MLGELTFSIEPPYVDPLAFAPQNHPLPNLAKVSPEVEVERKISSQQREWLFIRDEGRCNFPYINLDGTFGGYWIEEPSIRDEVNIHHIHEVARLRRSSEGKIALANGWHNSPSNLITLDKRVHCVLHSLGERKVNQHYRSLSERPIYENPLDWAIYQNMPITEVKYNNYLTAISVTRSWYMMDGVYLNWFPFDPMYKKHIKDQFSILYKRMPIFIDSFIESLK